VPPPLAIAAIVPIPITPHGVTRRSIARPVGAKSNDGHGNNATVRRAVRNAPDIASGAEVAGQQK